MNFIKKYYLLIFINLLFISCDFKEIESFEMPAWNWPLSFPLLDENYTFAEMGVNQGQDGLYYNASGDIVESSNNIFFDEIDSTLFIEFSANLLGDDGTRVGVDESFSSYFEIESPPFDSEEIGGVSLEDGGYDFTIDEQTISAPIPLPLGIFLLQEDIDPALAALVSQCNFFPATLIGSEGFLYETIVSEEIFNLEELFPFTSVDKITFDGGNVDVQITNNFPFKVDSTEIIFTSNNSTLFLNDSNENTFKFFDIEPNEDINQTFTINSDNTVEFGDSLDIYFKFFVNDLGGTGGENPYPILDMCRNYSNDGWYLCELPPEMNNCLDENGGSYDPWTETFFDVQVIFTISNAESITGMLEIDPITKIVSIPMQETQGIQVVGGHLVNEFISGKNSLNLNIVNNMFAPIDFSMQFSNFYSRDNILLAIDTTIDIDELLDHQMFFHDYYLGHHDTPGNVIDEIIVTTEISLDDSSPITFMLNADYELSIHDISFSDIKLEYVTAATEDLEFETPSISIDNIPSGFEGFEFADLNLEFNIFNQIGIPVNLNLELTGYKEIGESVTIIIDPELSYNNIDSDGNVFLDENASLQDSAWTRIILDKNGQTTYQYVLNEDKTEYILLESEDPNFENPKFEEKDVTILDVMTIAPDGLVVSGGAEIAGQGILAPETYVWGEFTMVAPLSFIFSENIQFIPAEPTILNAMDESTRNKIDSSLVVAKLNLDIINSIPIAGNIGLLVSDYNSSLCLDAENETCLENYFPVYFDDFVSNDLSAQAGEISQNYQSIFDQDLNFLEDLGVSIIEVEKLENDETFYINFLDAENEIIFFIGRIFNLIIEAPDEIDSQTGFTIIPSNYLDEIELDPTRIDWITSETQLFMMPMITFDNTDEFYCEDGLECISGYCSDEITECLREPRTFQTTNYIGINSFITFTLNTGSLFEKSKKIKFKNALIGGPNN